MGKVEQVYHRQPIYNKWRSPCMNNSRKNKTSTNWVWVPTIPSWEKDFCYKIGSFKWEDFLEAKKMTKYENKVLEWNDSEAEEAFHRAKNRFFAKINNLSGPDNEPFLDPDLCIDKNLDSDEINSELLDGLDFDDQGDQSNDDEDYEANDYVPDYYHIKIEDIKPTGWDIDLEDLPREHVLTGLIVGR
ncbi:hypothetical protein CASFOL_011969 [Castilleja foliolosa]|uniref:Uncharacterized protein n=1 Tax=Castilleja foliolosa TaxID=1961234 RepID=A0ABD3DPN3_9LAMI